MLSAFCFLLNPSSSCHPEERSDVGIASSWRMTVIQGRIVTSCLRMTCFRNKLNITDCRYAPQDDMVLKIFSLFTNLRNGLPGLHISLYLKIVCSLSGPTLTIEIGISSSSSNLSKYFLQFSGSFSYSRISVISEFQPLWVS